MTKYGWIGWILLALCFEGILARYFLLEGINIGVNIKTTQIAGDCYFGTGNMSSAFDSVSKIETRKKK